jgi:hypothetical protein
MFALYSQTPVFISSGVRASDTAAVMVFFPSIDTSECTGAPYARRDAVVCFDHSGITKRIDPKLGPQVEYTLLHGICHFKYAREGTVGES